MGHKAHKTIVISQKDINALRSGVPRLILSELEYFSSKGHKAYIVAERILNDPIKAVGGNPYKTFRWPMSGFFRRKFYMDRVAKSVKKLKPDLVIGHGDIIEQDICFIHNCVHLAYEKIHGKKIPPDHEMARIHGEILSKKKFKLLVCNSEMMKKDLTARFDLSDKEIFVHYPILDQKIFGQPSQHIRSQLGIENETLVIGLITSGNFKKRNVKLLLEVATQLETKQKLHIIIAGKDKKAPFNELIQKSKHPVSFLPPTDKVEEYYNTCDIFVLPAHIEEFGMSVLEAMASKKPVIVSSMVGSQEILEGDSKHFILQDLTQTELSEKLMTLIHDKELRMKLAELNYHTALKYSVQNQNQKFEHLLKQVSFM